MVSECLIFPRILLDGVDGVRMFDLSLENCRVDRDLTVNIGVDDGKIVQISRGRIDASERIDLKGYFVLPGLIDAHVHFRDPGLEYKEDFRTGSMAAAHGGFSTVLDMPNTVPPADNAAEFERKIRIGERKSVVDFGLHAGFRSVSDVKGILRFMPASFKVFMDLTGISAVDGLFRELKDLSAPVPVTVHCENRDVVMESMKELKDRSDPSAYALARPPLAEEVSVAEVLALSIHHEHPVHICHLSTVKALQLVEPFREYVTCEVTPHHLLLDSGAFRRFGTMVKTNPPLRPPESRIYPEFLDRINIIGTDHAPHGIEEKRKGIWDAPPGIPNLEVVLKLLLTLVSKGRMSLSAIRRMLAEEPARIFGLRSKGRIAEGMDADFTVIDLKETGRIRSDEFYSKAHYTPFEGFSYTGGPVMTMVRGRAVMRDGEVLEGNGRYIPAEHNGKPGNVESEAELS